jgi:hypothetical protein
MEAEKIAALAVASLPELLAAAGALVALCRSSGATDEQIRKVVGPAALDEIKDLNKTQFEDEESEAAIFTSASRPPVDDPTSAAGNPDSDGSGSLRA